MSEIPPLPTPESSNIRKATPGELAQEVITLRLYVAQLYTVMRHFKQILSELTSGAPARLEDAEASIADLRNRVFTLERANDERSRRPPTS